MEARMMYVFPCGHVVTLLSASTYVIKDMTGKTVAYGRIEHVNYRSWL